MLTAGFHHPSVRATRLLHQKKHRLERRCFLVEGPSLLEAAMESGASIEQVFVADDEAAGRTVELSKARLHSRRPQMLRVDRRTLHSLSQTKTPQGIVAVVGFIHLDLAGFARVIPADGPTTALVLPNLSDPGNAGTLVRSAAAFGASAVLFGPDAVEPYNDKVVRASMGSLFRVPIVRYESWSELVGSMRTAGLKLLAADASGDDVRLVTLPARRALVVGQERHGLSGIPRSDLDAVVALPHAADVDSLNAGVAGSLLLYEFARGQGLVGPQPTRTSRR